MSQQFLELQMETEAACHLLRILSRQLTSSDRNLATTCKCNSACNQSSIMGACCTQNGAVPDRLHRNTDSISNMDQQPLMSNGQPKSDAYPGEELTLNQNELVKYILKISPSELKQVWTRIDVDNCERIQIERDLPHLFLAIIDNYILNSLHRQTPNTKHAQKANSLANKLAEYFQSILENYEYDQGDTITKQFYLSKIQQYFREPNPGTFYMSISFENSIQSVYAITPMMFHHDVLYIRFYSLYFS